MRVHLVAGARPNFMKVAPLHRALVAERWCDPVVVHTGQHYDERLSTALLEDLDLVPDVILTSGSGSHAEQTAKVLLAYEALCLRDRPDWTIVVGDVNSTLAAALVAAKLGIPVAHLEAGLRSGDMTMPEEINRVVTDQLASLLWTPSRDADANLAREGVAPDRVELVGNIMIDSLEAHRPRIEADRTAESLGLAGRRYGVVTLHRPTNVDHPEAAAAAVDVLIELARLTPLVLPLHPRAAGGLERFGLLRRLAEAEGMHLVEPLPYTAFLGLVARASFVVTDSGGLQEETTHLGIPCITVRATTERPVTVTEGTNRLATWNDVVPNVRRALAGDWPTGSRPELWDGRTAARVVASLHRAVTSAR